MANFLSQLPSWTEVQAELEKRRATPDQIAAVKDRWWQDFAQTQEFGSLDPVKQEAIRSRFAGQPVTPFEPKLTKVEKVAQTAADLFSRPAAATAPPPPAQPVASPAPAQGTAATPEELFPAHEISVTPAALPGRMNVADAVRALATPPPKPPAPEVEPVQVQAPDGTVKTVLVPVASMRAAGEQAGPGVPVERRAPSPRTVGEQVNALMRGTGVGYEKGAANYQNELRDITAGVAHRAGLLKEEPPRAQVPDTSGVPRGFAGDLGIALGQLPATLLSVMETAQIGKDAKAVSAAKTVLQQIASSAKDLAVRFGAKTAVEQTGAGASAKEIAKQTALSAAGAGAFGAVGALAAPAAESAASALAEHLVRSGIAPEVATTAANIAGRVVHGAVASAPIFPMAKAQGADTQQAIAETLAWALMGSYKTQSGEWGAKKGEAVNRGAEVLQRAGYAPDEAQAAAKKVVDLAAAGDTEEAANTLRVIISDASKRAQQAAEQTTRPGGQALPPEGGTPPPEGPTPPPVTPPGRPPLPPGEGPGTPPPITPETPPNVTPPVVTAPEVPAAERRSPQHAELRSIFDQMTPDEQLHGVMDPLTGLANRNALDFHIANNPGWHTVMFDAKGFKNINDTYGHAAGDTALRHIASVMQEEGAGEQAGAFLARYGGDENVARVNGDAKVADAFAQRVAQRLEGSRVAAVDTDGNPTEIVIKGVRYGTGPDLESAQAALKAEHDRTGSDRTPVGAGGGVHAAEGPAPGVDLVGGRQGGDTAAPATGAGPAEGVTPPAIEPGARVVLRTNPGLGPLEVVDTSDKATLGVRKPDGRVIRVSRRTVRPAPEEPNAPTVRGDQGLGGTNPPPQAPGVVGGQGVEEGQGDRGPNVEPPPPGQPEPVGGGGGGVVQEVAPHAVTPNRRRNIILGKRGSRTVIFPSADEAYLFDTAAKILRATRSNAPWPDLASVSAVAGRVGYTGDRPDLAALDYRQAIINGARAADEGALFQAPPFTTPAASTNDAMGRITEGSPGYKEQKGEVEAKIVPPEEKPGVSHFPFGHVPGDRENSFFGTPVEVRRETLTGGVWQQTTVHRVLNGGDLIEVHNPDLPDDPQATFRTAGTDIRVLAQEQQATALDAAIAARPRKLNRESLDHADEAFSTLSAQLADLEKHANALRADYEKRRRYTKSRDAAEKRWREEDRRIDPQRRKLAAQIESRREDIRDMRLEDALYADPNDHGDPGSRGYVDAQMRRLGAAIALLPKDAGDLASGQAQEIATREAQDFSGGKSTPEEIKFAANDAAASVGSYPLSDQWRATIAGDLTRARAARITETTKGDETLQTGGYGMGAWKESLERAMSMADLDRAEEEIAAERERGKEIIEREKRAAVEAERRREEQSVTIAPTDAETKTVASASKKTNPTGFTDAQRKFIAEKLEAVYPDLPGPGEAESGATLTVQVPGDGKIELRPDQGAVGAFHKTITGEAIGKWPHEQTLGRAPLVSREIKAGAPVPANRLDWDEAFGGHTQAELQIQSLLSALESAGQGDGARAKHLRKLLAETPRATAGGGTTPYMERLGQARSPAAVPEPSPNTPPESPDEAMAAAEPTSPGRRRSGGGSGNASYAMETAAPVGRTVADTRAKTAELRSLLERPVEGAARTATSEALERGLHDADSAARPAPAGEADSVARSGLLDDLRRLFAPQTRGPEAKGMAQIIRRENAEEARRQGIAMRALERGKALFGRQDRETVEKFIAAMEGGNIDTLPSDLQPIAARLRHELDLRRNAVRALGTGKLEHYITDYFPHIWKQKGSAWERFMGKRPLEGSKSFLKRRKLETFADGIELGLEPVSWNPVELAMIRLAQMDKYLMAHRVLKASSEAGLAQYISAFTKPPEGWIALNDPIGHVYGPPTVAVNEAYDALLWNQLEDFARGLGVDTKRVMKMGRKWGYASGESTVRTRFGGPESVLMHELGHILDARYGMRKEVMTIANKFAKKDGVRGGTAKELRALSDLRWEGSDPNLVPQGFKSYVRRRPEQGAVILEGYLNARERMQETAPHILRGLDAFIDRHPELTPLRAIRRSLVMQQREGEVYAGGLVERGRWYLPAPAAQVLNNFLSPGLRGHALYRGARMITNDLNMAQLGLSAFHLMFTSLDASTSKAALAIQQAVSGQIGKSLTTSAEAAIAPVENFLRGRRGIREYYNPGSDPELAPLVNAVVSGGMHVALDKVYRTGDMEKLRDALRDHDPQGIVKHLFGGVLELVSYPLTRVIVPAQKMGVALDLAQHYLDSGKVGSDLTDAMTGAIDSVDNRMGQLVYDNLFWDPVIKDMGMVITRSLGWNIGTWRELAGGVADFGDQFRRARHGERLEMTTRMAYVIALPLVVGIAGAFLSLFYHLVFGAKLPEEAKDLYFVRTGRTLPNGQDERVNLASYMKDVFAFTKHPLTTVGHKASPLLSATIDMLQNEDFYGVRVRNEDDPIAQQIGQIAEYALREFVPFSFRNAIQRQRAGGDLEQQAESFFGITPAPASIYKTKARELMDRYVGENMPKGALTPEQKAQKDERRSLILSIRRGERPVIPAGFTRLQVKNMERTAKADPLTLSFRSLTIGQATRVWDAATPEERDQLRAAFVRKIDSRRKDSRDSDERAQLLKMRGDVLASRIQ